MRVRSIAILAATGFLTILTFQNCSKPNAGGASTQAAPNPTSNGGGTDLQPLAIPELSSEPPTPTGTLVINRLDGLNITLHDSADARVSALVARVTLSAAVEYETHLNVDISDDTAKENDHYKAPKPTVVVPAGKTSVNISIPLINRTSLKSSKFQLHVSSASVGNIVRGTANMTIPAWTPYEAIKFKGLSAVAVADYPGNERIKDVACVYFSTQKRHRCSDKNADSTFFDYLIKKQILCTTMNAAGGSVCYSTTKYPSYQLQPEGGYCIPNKDQELCFVQKSGIAGFVKRRTKCTERPLPANELMRRYDCAK